MKIDFSLTIDRITGAPIQVEDVEGKPDYTLRDVAVNALLADTPEAVKLGGKEKVQRFRLADRIYGCKEPIKLEAEEIVLVKEQIAKTHGVLATARAWDILDGKEDAPAES
jgi:hypothetical protein